MISLTSINTVCSSLKWSQKKTVDGKKCGGGPRPMRSPSKSASELYLLSQSELSLEYKNWCLIFSYSKILWLSLLLRIKTSSEKNKNFYLNSFFLRTARHWNSLPIECFPLTYDLSGFRSKINRHLLTADSSWRDSS